jgi:Ca2+-transporting ATPase
MGAVYGFKQDIRYVPGRIRIRVPGIYKNQKSADAFTRYISSKPGVTMVYADSCTGRALIFFEEDRIKPSALTREVVKTHYIISVLGPEKLIFREKPENEAKDKSLKWSEMSINQVIAAQRTNPLSGLDGREARHRLALYGKNSLFVQDKKSFWRIFISQFKQFLPRVLVVAGGLSFLLGEIADGVTIAAIVILEAFLQSAQEYKAEEALAELNRLSASRARVIRDARPLEISSDLVVPGDVIELSAGCKVPADARVIEAHGLEVVESALTGESLPISKNTSICRSRHLAELSNMVFMGTFIVKGRGRAIVIATGRDTRMGQIGNLLSSIKESSTPLQQELECLGKSLTFLCLGLSSIVVLSGIIRRQSLLPMLRVGISLAVSIIPEGLSAILAISLSFSTRRMARENVIVRKMQAIETLGSTTVICCDKTGTLTKNEMTVKEIFCGGELIHLKGNDLKAGFYRGEKEIIPSDFPDLCQALTCAALCNNVKLEADGTFDGDPTEVAMLKAVLDGGLDLDDLLSRFSRIHEVPFDSTRQRMAVVFKEVNGKNLVFLKGAPDVILEYCNYIYFKGNVAAMDEEQKKLLAEQNNKMADDALRVLAVAYRELPEDYSGDQEIIDRDLVFGGLLGMADPARPEAREAIQKCHRAGIHVVMITGDHPSTATALARELTLLNGGKILTGADLDRMSQKELEKEIEHVTVFARTLPEHKLKIVKAFKNTGHIVAMTGDGVNDAPAIKEADIGIAMGKNGTDVTREASSVTITDDNFITIVRAVEEGRAINDNIKKFLRYVLSGNLGEVSAIMLTSLAGLPVPLSPGQILWINLVTEGGPALALGLDQPSRNIMDRMPRNPQENILDPKTSRQIVAKGTGIGLSTFGVFLTALSRYGLPKAQTMAFANIVTSQMMNVYDVRKNHAPQPENSLITPSVAMSIAMMLSVIYTPGVGTFFGTVPLSLVDWLFILALSRLGLMFRRIWLPFMQ